LFWLAAIVFKYSGGFRDLQTCVLLVSLSGVYGTYNSECCFTTNGRQAAAFFGYQLGYVHFHNDIHTDQMLVVRLSGDLAIAAYYNSGKIIIFIWGESLSGLCYADHGTCGMVIPGAAVGCPADEPQLPRIFYYRWLIAIPMWRS
jgi:hypothetical protein